VHLTPEFRLVLACCLRPSVAQRRERVRHLADGVDWDLVQRIAQRHRVEGLVWNGLGEASVPLPEAEGIQRLRERALAIARDNLFMTRESIRLKRLFGDAGIGVLFFKGITLGQLAYGTAAVKMGRDVDVLIHVGDVEKAARILEAEGYALITPEGAGARSQLGLWHRHWKESVWRSGDRRIYVELHTALADNPALLQGVGMDAPLQEVPVGSGETLPTLAIEPLFAYLCVHGASSAWFRLKWAADLAALLSSCTPEEIDALFRRSQQLGAGRAAAQALLLCHRLFETPLPPALLAELQGKRVNRLLLAVALRKLTGRSAVREVQDLRLGTATIHLSQAALLGGWRFAAGEIRRQLMSPYDMLAVPLPRALHFLYPAVFVLRRLRPRRG